MNIIQRFPVISSLLFLSGVSLAFRVAAANGSSEESRIEGFLFLIVIVLLAAKIGGELMERWNQPAVLGELIAGVILGNLSLIGITHLEMFKTNEYLALVAELGVILLLFEVGLDSNLRELAAVGLSAVVVATLGVIAPTLLGYGVSRYFLPEAGWYVHLFAGATLAATSVGITARVLQDLGKINSAEARIILGAAVVDDVLGLIMLAVVTGLVNSLQETGSVAVPVGTLFLILAKAGLFFILAVGAGQYLGGWLLRAGARAKVKGMAVVLSVCYCFTVAGLAQAVGLAPIVGAFAAGLVLNESHFEGYTRLCARRFEEIVTPIGAVFTPVFFVYMGLRVDLHSFGSAKVVLFATALSVAAILGKQICGLGVFEKGVSRLGVGVGMIPRGEVGLIFASIGSSVMVAGAPVFSPDTYSAMVIMVMVTTLVTPPLLKPVLGANR